MRQLFVPVVLLMPLSAVAGRFYSAILEEKEFPLVLHSIDSVLSKNLNNFQ